MEAWTIISFSIGYLFLIAILVYESKRYWKLRQEYEDIYYMHSLLKYISELNIKRIDELNAELKELKNENNQSNEKA